MRLDAVRPGHGRRAWAAAFVLLPLAPLEPGGLPSGPMQPSSTLTQSTSPLAQSASPSPAPQRPWGRLAMLFGLYLVQGVPFGFQIGALPVFLREAGVSLTTIGFASALALPWSLKIFWAPAVERWYWLRLGRRRSWIIPTQLGLVAVCAAAAWFEPVAGTGDIWPMLGPLLALVLAMNLLSATMDVAVDGLAVDLLTERDLGYGNIAQVVGYKFGMIISGGLLLAASEVVGWTGMFALMSVLVAAGAVIALCWRETSAADTPDQPSETQGAIVRRLFRALRVPGIGWLLVFIATYKLGETMADTLFKPFLVDNDFSKAEIGLWVGTYGMVASISGSVLGGILASRRGLLWSVAVCAAARIVPIVGELWLSLTEPTATGVILVTVSEHFTSGALTTAMFAYMMSRVDRAIGGTHFTFFATIEVTGKQLAGWGAGLLADATSYPFVFGLAVVASVAFMALLIPISRLPRAHTTDVASVRT